jgi:hypothetical protein
VVVILRFLVAPKPWRCIWNCRAPVHSRWADIFAHWRFVYLNVLSAPIYGVNVKELSATILALRPTRETSGKDFSTESDRNFCVGNQMPSVVF